MVDINSIKDNVLINADCLDAMQSIPDKSIDMICCDPPYGTTHAEWDAIIDTAQMWAQYRRIIKDHGAIVLFGVLPFICDLIDGARDIFRYELIWKKTLPMGFLNVHRMPLRVHENILVFYKHQPKYNPQKWKSTPYVKTVSCAQSTLYNGYGPHSAKSLDGTRYPVDVLTFSNASRKGRVHPTEKPVPLIEWLVKTYSDSGDIILDNAMGGGSCGIACANTGRRFIGMETDKTFFTIAEKRINEAYRRTDPRRTN